MSENELINTNLKLIFESEKQSLLKYSLIDENGNRMNDPEYLVRILEREGLINIEVSRCLLSKFGKGVSEKGGWLIHLAKEQSDNKKLKEREDLEFEKSKIEYDLAKSNIRANKLNEKNSNFNKKVNNINIFIGILNFVVAVLVGILAYLTYIAD